MEDKELKPIYSPFLRRLDPMLAAEDANPVFLAFRRRREVHGNKSFFSRRTKTLATVFGGLALSLVLVGAIFFASRMFTFPFNVLAAVLVIGWIIAMFITSKSDATGLPQYATAIFGDRTLSNKQILFDLYMTDTTGRDFAEAIYLESRRNALQSAIWQVIFVVGLQILFYVILLRAFSKFTSPELTVAFTLLLVWQCFELFDAAGKGHRMQAVRLAKAQAIMEKTALRFEPVSAILKKEFLRLIFGAFMAGAVIVGGFVTVILGFGILAGFVEFLEHHQKTSFLCRYVLAHAALLVYICLVATALLLRTLTRRFFDARMERKLRNDFAETSDLFSAVMRAHASEDQEMKEYLWAEFKAREAARKQSRSSPMDSAPPPPTSAMAS